MAFITTHFFADTLGKATTAEVLLPERPVEGRPVPALYLLHGLSDDETIWMRRTALELFAGGYYLAVVMPDGGRSFYCDTRSGARYQEFVARELPDVMESYFPLARDRANRFIAGHSMGGWGAFKTCLNNPGRYAAAAGLSSVIDLKWLRGENPALFASILGEGWRPSPRDDLFRAAEEVAKLPEAERPRLFQYCGTDDFLWKDNVRFRDHMAKLGLGARWEQGPGGHSWENWNKWIRRVLGWLPLSENVVRTGAIGI